MSLYADSSFLVSAFGVDANTPKALVWLRKNAGNTILVSRLTLFEAENAARGFVLTGRMTHNEMQQMLKRITMAMQQGWIVRREVPAHQWFPQAHRISVFGSSRYSCGALDILHVAAAVVLKTSVFLSFDQRQSELAATEGLRVMP